MHSLSDEKIVEYLNIVEVLLGEIKTEMLERKRASSLAVRVLACLDIPRQLNEVSKMMAIDSKNLKSVLDLLTRKGDLVFNDGYFMRRG